MSEQPYKIGPAGFGDGVRPVTLQDGGNTYTPSLFSRDFVRRLRRNGLRLAIWVVLCLAAAVAYIAHARPEFTASAQLVLEPRLRIPVGADPSTSGLAPILDSAQAESQVQILKSERVLRFVFDSLKLENDPAYAPPKEGSGGGLFSFFRSKSAQDEAAAAQSRADLAREQAFQAFTRQVSVRRVGQSYLIEVTFRALSPSAAARIANSIAASYIRDQVVFRAAPDMRGSEFLQGRISSVQAQKQAATEAVMSGVIPDVQFPDADARIVSSALEPLTKAFPQTKIILLVAVVAALITGIGMVALSFTFDRKVWSEQQLERASGLESLASFSIRRIRDDMRRYSTAVTHPDSEFARALKTLWIKLASASVGSGEMAIAFVAVERGDGQTTIGANLAHLLAHNDERATLVDADFQRAALTRCYAPQSAGSLRDFIHTRSPEQLGEIGLKEDLRFIPAVSSGTSIGTDVFLGSTMVRTLIGELTKRGSLILDVPPLRNSADAIAVGRFLTGVVVVAVSGRTNGDDLAEAVKTLRAANARVLGAVLINET